MEKILLVDDDLDLLYGLQHMLTKSGYEVHTLSQGTYVLQELEQFTPDLMILDINLGVMDGRQICESIKKLAAYQYLPILLYSAEDHPDLNVADCRAEAFIQKPFSRYDFLQQVIRCIHPTNLLKE